MARQVIDTTTNNGSYIGDPAKTAFDKINSMTGEIYSGSFAPVLTGNGSALGRVAATTPTITAALSAVNAVNEVTFGSLTNHPVGVYINSIRRGGWDTSGNFTATSLNPTSTSDVKDYIEGFAEDASALLDRLVVITYRYRPFFVESDESVIGLLQENVKSVLPGAASDSVWVKDDIEGEDVDRLIPGNYDITQIVAINVRAHQEKNRRIRLLEEKVESLLLRLDAAGI